MRFIRIAPLVFALAGMLSSCERHQAQTAVATVAPGPSPAVERLLKASEAGDIKAQIELASRFDAGNEVKKDQEKAFQLYLKAANAGNVEAMAEIAQRYSVGKGVRKDANTSNQWLRRAAEAGSARAQHRLAATYGAAWKGFNWIWGNGETELRANSKLYVEWLTKAAAQNYAEAKYDLGMLWLLGGSSPSVQNPRVLIEPLPDKGLALISEAATAGYWKAQWAMAVIYQAGFGKIKPDSGLSDKWWDTLAKQTTPEAQRGIGYWYSESNPKIYEAGRNKWRGRALSADESNQIAAEWFEKASAQGDAQATYALATIYMEGSGVSKNQVKAIELLSKAAERGVASAQLDLAMALYEGTGTTKDYGRALDWLIAAAVQDDFESARARNAVGAFFEFGYGVDRDPVLAYAWYNIGMSGGYAKAKENLARLERILKPDEVRAAQDLSRDWKPGKVLTRSGAVDTLSTTTGLVVKQIASGTGFFISKSGDVLTNNHVIAECREIRIPAENKTAKLVVADISNDLAIIRVDTPNGESAVLTGSDDLRQGEQVLVFGYPLDGYLPSSGNISIGIVSALAGPGNNATLIQISAPVQPGNSGGPVLNMRGGLVGVVVGKADAIRIAKITGDIPQNISFAISARTVKPFLEANQIGYEKQSIWQQYLLSKDTAELAERARKISVKLECWR
jgi:uncharacterized protein